ncbi:IS1 family transposase [Capnocytophaga catalasegens]|uniref:IS1 family transposase n=1 Tax=Capnocytophaga catalasegens TaxID=1004260 RepID=UPI002230D83C|nr:IS1 family transposase [Capnocytophaga catalasegens]
MTCPKCKSSQSIKDGKTNAGKQRYKRKNCNYHFSVEKRCTEKTDKQKRLALQLYLEGMGFRAIGRVLQISYGTIFQWVKKWGKQAELPQKEAPIEIVELDKIHTYIQHKKNYCWIWIAVDRFGKRIIDFVCRKRNTLTFSKLYNRLKNKDINLFCSDYWKSYKELNPSKNLCQSKSETYTIEGFNSLIRHYLVRFKRKTKCYSKSQKMIEYSLKLLFLELNSQLTIFV